MSRLKRDWESFVIKITDLVWAGWLILLRAIGLGFKYTAGLGAKIYNQRFVERHNFLVKFFFSIVAIIFSVFVWLFFKTIMSTFSTVLGLVGLRSGDYDLSEQLLAWFPVIFLCLVLPYYVSDYRLLQLTQILIYSTIVLGLNILIGFSGQISLGHAAFVSIGSFTSAYVLANPILGFNIPLLGSIVIGCAAAGITGFLCGIPAVRVKGPHLALITLGLSLSIPKILKSSYLEPYTGGTDGVFITQPKPPETWTFINEGQWRYYIILMAFACATVAAYYILWKSRYGRALITLAQSEEKALALGINVAKYKLLAFTLSAMFAGLGGVMMTIILGYASPDSFTFLDSIDYLVAVAVGGLTSVFGSLLGGVFLAYQTDFNATLAQFLPRGEELRWAVYGVVVIFFMVFIPRGISGEIRRIIYVMFADLPIRRKSIMEPPPNYDYPYRNKYQPLNEDAVKRDQVMEAGPDAP